MEFWVIGFIGILIFIGTSISVNKLAYKNASASDIYYRIPTHSIEDYSRTVQVIMHLLVIISITLVGGFVNSKFYCLFVPEINIFVYFLIDITPAFLTYDLIHIFLRLSYFKRIFSQICFVVVFIISIICWTIPIYNYNRNIEKITETTITSTQERKLLFFCNIPVQEISGQISGSSFSRSGISGSISTSNELSYWYVNENGEGKYSSVNANSSKIVFISNDNEKKPYLEIINYCTYTKSINHNNGIENTETDKEWKEYIFYLPEEIMQYSLD